MSEPTCEVMLENLGYERREIEPQPCGRIADWIVVGEDGVTKTSCHEHVGSILSPGQVFVTKLPGRQW